MLLNAIKEHHSGLMETDRLGWILSPPVSHKYKSQAFFFHLVWRILWLQMHSSAANLHHRTSIPRRITCFSTTTNSSVHTQLCCLQTFHESRQKESPLTNTWRSILARTQNSTKLPGAPRISLYFTVWNDSSCGLTRPSCCSWHQNRDGFVTCFPAFALQDNFCKLFNT